MDVKQPRPTRPPVRNVSQQDLQRRVIQTTVPQPTPVRPQVTPRPPQAISLKAPKISRLWRGFQVVMSVLILLAVLGIGWWLWQSEEKNDQTAIDTSKYQAAFLVNGQAYYGKLKPFTDTAMKMTDVYYLQPKKDAEASAENSEQSADEQNSVELIKLGEEIHGPEDEVIILIDQLLYYENLKSDSKLVKSIERYKQTQVR